ncbi:MAG: ParA family protein [Anaerolineaceae bacterium]|nr:ParA family protein [Anaerolineaceae bacterium]
MTYVIGVTHQKGGVGKSTTVATLGACLAEQSGRTLVVDLDPSGNMTSGLGYHPEEMEKSIASLLVGQEVFANVVKSTSLQNLDILPSNPDLLSISRHLFSYKGYEFLLRDILRRHAGNYKWVVVDCPPTLGTLTITALTAAQLAMIPTQLEFYSLQALDVVFKLINMTRSKTNPRLRYRLLVTMYDRRGRFHTDILTYVRQHYSKALMESVIGFDTKVRASQLAGVPLTMYARSSRAAKQYRELAQELEAYVERQVIQPA